jgi:hypothetical protein
MSNQTNWYTDYPFSSFGDTPFQLAPKREVKIIEFQRHPYVLVEVFDSNTNKSIRLTMKSYYIYNLEITAT